MSESHSDQRGLGPDPGMHLPEWTLEQLAEGDLAPQEHREAMRHVAACGRCAAELEGYRALFAALGDVPRFAPSPGFSDAVMARIQIAPRTSPALARARRWLPRTTRGWTLLAVALVAPALPLLAAVAWLLSQPMVSAASIWQWASLETQTSLQAAGALLLQWGSSTGVVEWFKLAYQSALQIPLGALSAALVLLAVAMPLSMWALVRLVRTPMRDATYAN
jgi:hypothetical protein